MRRLSFIFITILCTSCSFDNKTGIWKDASNLPVDDRVAESISNDSLSRGYEDVFTQSKIFNEEKESSKFFYTEDTTPLRITNWPEQYATPTNNISNFFYSGNKILLSKSPKLGKSSSTGNFFKRKIVFYKNNLISHDHKGKIFIYSLKSKKKIFEYNFYQKKFKKYNKEINFIVNKNILYAADNLGYLYALDLEKKSIVWAKNYGIPFRSNLKFTNNQLFVANQDNVIYSIDSSTGDKKWKFSTQLTLIKSDFENTFALDLSNNVLFFLNTSGELYSINILNQNVNWVLNFKNSSLANDAELFFSQPIVLKYNNLIITTENAVLNLNTSTGKKNWDFSIEPILKPIITINYTYILSENNLLICLDNTNGNVLWSQNILKNIKDKKIKKNFNSVIDLKIVNNKINIYSKNGHLLSFNPSNGNLSYSSKISKNGISSEIFFLNNNMLFVDNANKLLKFN
jgi:outer membrane protein assembly factor BamB